VPEVPHTVGDVLKGRGDRPLVTIAPTATAAEAADLFRSRGISQLPVLDRGKPVGSVHEVTLARVLHDHRDPAKVAIGEVMARPLPQLDVGTHLDEAYRLLLSGNTGVLATQNGEVVGIVTRIDLIDYWTRQRAAGGTA
jgi:cystathionine beta-synthase